LEWWIMKIMLIMYIQSYSCISRWELFPRCSCSQLLKPGRIL
jgi:hypothetical protein